MLEPICDLREEFLAHAINPVSVLVLGLGRSCILRGRDGGSIANHVAEAVKAGLAQKR